MVYLSGAGLPRLSLLDGGGGHWLVRMEWRPAGWTVCLPLLIFPCTIKSRSFLLAPADPSGPGKGPKNGCGGVSHYYYYYIHLMAFFPGQLG